MSRLKLGDTVRRKVGRYETYPNGSPYNLPEGEGVICEYYSDSSINVRYGSLVTPPVNGEAFELVQSEGPVRTETVTTRRIVPGVYGRLEVTQVLNRREGAPEYAVVKLALRTGSAGGGGDHALSATELDDLAMVASQLADALRDQ